MGRSESGRIDSLEKSKRKVYSSIINDDVDYLHLLVKKFFVKERSDLFTILYEVYNEAVLKNVPLSDKIKLEVEVYLLKLYPHGDDTTCWSVTLVQKIIKEMRNKLDKLKCCQRRVDQMFLYVMSSLSRDINVLKRLLKCSYDRLPWEEMEFCAAVFVLSRRSVSETNVYCHAYLSVERILKHLSVFQALLESFGDKLDSQTDQSKWAQMPKDVWREDVVKKIREKTPETSLLYEDFNRLRDIHSLSIIDSYLDLVRSSDPMELEGRLVILRSLQVIGEHLKNTLETPKLSQNSVNLIIHSMKTHTWKMVTQIRDKIFRNLLQAVSWVWDDLNVFVKIKHDLEKTRDMVRELLNRLKINSFTVFVKKFDVDLSCDETEEVWDCLDFIDTDKFKRTLCDYGLNTTKLEDMIAQLRNSYATNRSKIIFDQAYSTTHSQVRKYEINCCYEFTSIKNSLRKMKQLKHRRHEPQLQQYITKEMRMQCMAWNFRPETQNMVTIKELRKLLTSHFNSIEGQEGELVEAGEIIRNLTADYGSAKSIQVLGRKFQTLFKSNKTDSINMNPTNEVELTKYWSFFEEKLELKDSTASLTLKDDPVARVLTELYVILKHSYLDKKRQPTCDKYPRILNGNNLRNHVAHNNIINEILQLDTRITLMANSIALCETRTLEHVNQANRSVDVQTIIFFNNYKNDMRIIETQKKLFDAVRAGDFDYMKKLNIDDIRGLDIKSRSLVHYALFSEKQGILERIFKLFPECFLINSQDINLETPLHIAARLGRTVVAEFLLKLGAKTDLTDRNGFLPIHTASASGSQKILRAILQKSNDPVDEYKTNYEGFTALHLATMFGRINIVKDLINNKAKVNTLSYSGVSPLFFALLIGSEDVVKTLVSHGAGLNEDLPPLLHAATFNENEENLEYLLNHGIGGKEIHLLKDYPLLHTAAMLNRRRSVEIILERYGVDVDVTTLAKDTPLHYAVGGFRLLNVFNKKDKSNLSVIKLLIEKGCSLNVKSINDVTPLYLSLDRQISVTRLLLDSGADVDTPIMNGATVLHAAACAGYVETVRLLLEYSCNINVTDNLGRSPLHVAVIRDDNIDTVKLLIRHGMSINSEDNEGNVPLHYAATHNSKTLTDFLLKKTNAVDKANSYGSTPLHLAAQGGFVEIVKALIDRDAAVNVTDALGNSPLHLAVNSGLIDTVKILVEKNADINMTNKNRLSPLALAAQCDEVSIVDFLLKRKALVDDVAIIRAMLQCQSRISKLLEIFQKNEKLTSETCLKDGFKTSSDYTRILCCACNFSTSYFVKRICENNSVNVENEHGWTPLHIAVWNGDVDIVEILLKQGADITARGKLNIPPLVLAIVKGRFTTLKSFFKSKPNCINYKDEIGYSLLHHAVLHGQESIVCFLLKNGADFNISDNEGLTPIQLAAVKGFGNVLTIFINENYNFKVDRGPGLSALLHLAAKHGNTKVIKLLLKYKVEVDVRDDYGDTPLKVALKKGQKDAVVILLARGAQLLGICDSYQLNPDIKMIINNTKFLHHAVRNNNVKEVKKCFENGAVLDAITEESETALQLAVRKRFVDVAKFLLKNNCDPNLKNKRGVTALHLAAQSCDCEMVNHLLAVGALYDSPTDKGDTPLDLTENKIIKKTLKFIDSLYKRVKTSNGKITETQSNHISQNPWIPPILQNVKNRDRATILEMAYRSNFLDIDELKKLLLPKIIACIDIAMKFKIDGLYEEAIKVTNKMLEDCQQNRKNPVVSWDLRTLKADLLRCTENYDSALTILNEVLDEQIESLGEDHNITLTTSSVKAESLMFSGRNDEALTILQKIYVKRNKNYKNDINLYFTKVNIAKALNNLGRSELALRYSEKAFSEINRIRGANDLTTIDAKGVYAISLNHVGRYDEALKINKDILDSLENLKFDKESLPYKISLVCFCETLSNLGRCEEALKNFNHLLKANKQYPSLKARIQNNILSILSMKGESFKAFKLGKRFYDEASSILGENHPEVTKIKDTINLLNNMSENVNLEKMLEMAQEEIDDGDSQRRCMLKIS